MSIAKNSTYHSICDLLLAPNPHTQALTFGCV